MPNQEAKNQFIELRAVGASLKTIAEKLQLSERTLIRWNQELKTEIANQRNLLLEAEHEQILPKYGAELSRLTSQLDKVESILAQRRLDFLSTKDLFNLARNLRAQIRNRAMTPVFSVPKDEPPPADTPQPEPQNAAAQP